MYLYDPRPHLILSPRTRLHFPRPIPTGTPPPPPLPPPHPHPPTSPLPPAPSFLPADPGPRARYGARVASSRKTKQASSTQGCAARASFVAAIATGAAALQRIAVRAGRDRRERERPATELGGHARSRAGGTERAALARRPRRRARSGRRRGRRSAPEGCARGRLPSPGSQPPRPRHSSRIAGPPARWIAPSTPPPPSSSGSPRSRSRRPSVGQVAENELDHAAAGKERSGRA